MIADEGTTIRSLVTSGVGLTLMMEKDAYGDDAEGELVIVKKEVGAVDLSLIYLRRRLNDPLIRAVSNAVHTVWNLKGSPAPDADIPLRERQSA